jgi:hypothetical protein
MLARGTLLKAAFLSILPAALQTACTRDSKKYPVDRTDHVTLSTPIVRAWRELSVGEPVHTLVDVTKSDRWLGHALVEAEWGHTGISRIELEAGYTIFRIYPYLAHREPLPRAFQGMVLKVRGQLSEYELITAIRKRDPSVAIDEFLVFGEDGETLRRSDRPRTRFGPPMDAGHRRP